MIFTTGLFVAATVVGVSAQNTIGGGYNLSAPCQAAVANVLSGPAGTCLGVSGLVNMTTIQSGQSIVPATEAWLTTTCAQPACSNSTIDAVIANITTGCQSDLTSWGAGNVDVQTVQKLVETYYPPTREVLCLKDSNNSDQFCVITALKSLETMVNTTMSMGAFWQLAPAYRNLGPAAAKDFACTTCAQAAYGMVRPYLNPETQTTVDTQLNSLCGAGFTNTTAPPNIKKTATTSTNSNSNGAMSVTAFGSAAALVLGSVGALALLL